MKKQVIGPKMQEAVRIVTANPGKPMLHTAERLHRACAQRKNNAYGYNPIIRAVKAGLLRIESRGRVNLVYPAEQIS